MIIKYAIFYQLSWTIVKSDIHQISLLSKTIVKYEHFHYSTSNFNSISD